MPGTKLSLRAISDLVRSLLHREQRHIGGEITAVATGGLSSSEDLVVNLRILRGVDVSTIKPFTVSARDVDGAIQHVAEQVVRAIAPYAAAVYHSSVISSHHPQDWDLAVQIVADMIADPNTDKRHRAAAYNLWGNYFGDEPTKALEKFKASIAEDPEFAPPYNNLGFLLQQEHQYERAVANYQTAIKLDAKFPHPYYNWGRVLVLQGQPEQAMQKFKAATMADPSFWPAYQDWSDVLERSGKHDDAIKIRNAKDRALDKRFIH